MYGNKGTDGLLYADRTPLPNYYELQHNYARAAVTDSKLNITDGQREIPLHIRNRFDFLNLKDNASFSWTLTEDRDTVCSGAFSPDCKPHATTTYSLSLPTSPDTTDTFLSELGIAFLLDKKIDRVQWIGQGMMPTYPGRYRAGRYGFWAMQQGDLYFEGNRRGVDAAMLTDGNGDGLLLVCNNGNVSFEQTDRGIVLTYNAAVSGEGPKFARTAFPVIANKVGTVGGDFYLYRIDKTKPPQLLRTLFAAPKTVPAPFHPYETQYDTYLMRFEDVVR